MSDDTDRALDATEIAAAMATPSVAINALGTVHYSVKQTARVGSVLARLHGARRSLRLYPRDHPAAKEAVGLLGDAIRSYHDEGVDLQLVFFNDEIHLGDQLLAWESMQFSQLVLDISATGLTSLVVRQGVHDREIADFVEIVASDVAQLEASGGVEELAADALMPHIEVSAVRALNQRSKAAGELAEEPAAVLGSAVALLQEMDRLLQGNASVSAGRVKGVVNSLVDSVLENRHALLRLASIKNYDEYTYYHSANVAVLALALGAAISTDERFLGSLGVGALLHDLGKLSIDQSVSTKRGPLTPDEWEAMRQHPVTGAETVALLPGVDRTAVVTVLEHHMRWDGTGYPESLRGRGQHLTSRIVAVADAYDAMTSERSYAPARLPDDAMMQIAEGAGSALDPMLARLFVRLIGVYPGGSMVRLSDGGVAVVLAAGADPLRPLVRIVATADGELVTPTDLDLAETRTTSVAHCIDPERVNVHVRDYL